MTRRPQLPGAAELFRRTDPIQAAQAEPAHATATMTAPRGHAALPAATPQPMRDLRIVPPPTATPSPAPVLQGAVPTTVQTSGRTKHDEKITVYCSADELLAMEQARLTLRAQHRISADRGMLVRTAVAVLLADLDARGEESALVQHLLRD